MPPVIKKRTTKRAPLRMSAVQDLLVPTVAFLRESGITTAQLMSEWRTAIDCNIGNRPRLKVVHIGFGQFDSAVVSRWLRDPTFLNKVGKPVDLPLKGKVSITSLVKASEISVSPSRVLSSLTKFGSVREISTGKYRLIRRLLNFVGPDAFPFEPNFQFLVDAARASTWGAGAENGEPRLFWQNAINTNIPNYHVSEFLKFSYQRGLIFVHEINDWLEAHQGKNPKSNSRSVKKSKRLGIGLFGICSDSK